LDSIGDAATKTFLPESKRAAAEIAASHVVAASPFLARTIGFSTRFFSFIQR
jgi:hypothetical protein